MTPSHIEDTVLLQLRALLLAPPSLHAFECILELFQQWDDLDTLELGLEYAEEHLQDWDSSMRRAIPEEVWPSFPKGQPLPLFRLVRSLDLEGRRLNDEEIKEIVNLAPLEILEDMNLMYNHIHSEGAESIAQSPYLFNLKTLFMGYNNTGFKGAEAFAHSQKLPQLTFLELQANDIGERGCETLGMSPHLSSTIRINYLSELSQKHLLRLAHKHQVTTHSHMSSEQLIDRLLQSTS